MAVVRRTVARPVDQVFAALADPETYPSWLVGCKEIRAVEAAWPKPGSKFFHRVGLLGPLTVQDDTKVVDVDDPNLLVLEVRARPFGRGLATFSLQDGGNGEGTIVTLDEVPIGALAVTKPLADPVIAHRNRISLEQLADFLEGGGYEDPEGSSA